MVIVCVVARLFHYCQTPKGAQKFLLPVKFFVKTAVHYLGHQKSNNIIGQKKTSKEKHFYP